MAESMSSFNSTLHALMVGDTARAIIAAPDQRVADALQEVRTVSCLYLVLGVPPTVIAPLSVGTFDFPTTTDEETNKLYNLIKRSVGKAVGTHRACRRGPNTSSNRGSCCPWSSFLEWQMWGPHKGKSYWP